MSKITDKGFESRQEAAFVEIMDRIQTQNDDIGAVFLEATGIPGVAKTAVILTFLEDTIINHPDQKCFWRNPFNAPFQFTKLGPGKWEIFIEEDSEITFHDRDDKLKKINIPYKTFTNFDKLYEQATPGKCTAVFFKDQIKWIDFLKYLNSIGEWTHVFLDEYGELFPFGSSGALYKRIQDASDILKEVRKCRTNVYATTQVTSDVDYRVRNKLMVLVYMYGAKPMSRSKVSQYAIDSLDRDLVKGNEGWIEYGYGIYGKGRFTKIYKPIPGQNWEAHAPEDAPAITDYMKKGYEESRPPGRPRKMDIDDEEK